MADVPATMSHNPSMTLRREDALAFARRDWGAIRANKDRSMYEWVQRKGTRAALELGDALHRQVAPRARAVKAAEAYDGLVAYREVLRRAYDRDR